MFDRILGLKNSNSLLTRNQADRQREEQIKKADRILEAMQDIVALPHFIRFKNGESNRRSADLDFDQMSSLQQTRCLQRTTELKSAAEQLDGDLDYLIERLSKL